MTLSTRRSLDEVSQLGIEMFTTRIAPILPSSDMGKFVAIDVNSGDYESDPNDYAAVARLRARRPDAEVWLERAGEATAYKIRAMR